MVNLNFMGVVDMRDIERSALRQSAQRGQRRNRVSSEAEGATLASTDGADQRRQIWNNSQTRQELETEHGALVEVSEALSGEAEILEAQLAAERAECGALRDTLESTRARIDELENETRALESEITALHTRASTTRRRADHHTGAAPQLRPPGRGAHQPLWGGGSSAATGPPSMSSAR